MKVVHSCTSLSFSGLEAYVLELAHWQYSQGKDVELYCREGSELAKRAQARGVPLWLIGHDERPGPGFVLRMAKQWRSKLKAGPVTLHMHAGGEPKFHLPAALGAKIILHFHIWINHRKKDPFHWALYRAIDEVWTSSESARAHLATLLPIGRERIRVVPYGRDVQALKRVPAREWRVKLREQLGVTEDDCLAVCVSRVEPIKGIRELFEAFTALADQNPQAHLALVGGPSPENAEAEALWRELQARHGALTDSVRRRLHLLGFVSPCEPVLTASDFYVLPTYEECMSLAMLDAAILGLPIVGTNSGGTPSVARPGETGWLVAPKDAGDLARAMTEAYRDAQQRQKLAQAARVLGEGFDREAIFRKIWDWYA